MALNTQSREIKLHGAKQQAQGNQTTPSLTLGGGLILPISDLIEINKG